MKTDELLKAIQEETGHTPSIGIVNLIYEFAQDQYQAGYDHAFDKFADDSYIKDFIYGKKEDWE
jgi:hypothetical protein